MFDKLIEFLLNIIEQVLPFFIIHEYEMGVMYDAGKFHKIVGPGFHWKYPFIDSFQKDNVVQDTMWIKEVNITTLDGKTVTVGCEFDLEITDIYKAINDTNNWRDNMHDIARGILSDTLEDIHWDEIRKKTTKNRIANRIHQRALEMGITTSNFNFTDKAISRAYKLFNDN